MESIPLPAQIGVIVALLLLSAFFSISETAMVALNRHRLKLYVQQGKLGARKTQKLLARTDRLLSIILISSSLINTIIPVLTTSIALRVFGNDHLALSIMTGGAAFLIIVCSEITPKIVGATYPEKIALPASLVLDPLMRAARPIVWFANLCAAGILRVLRIDTHNVAANRLSLDELRAIVLESAGFMPHQHRSILLNLFELESISVDDVMVPRARIEALNFDAPIEQIVQQLDICYHSVLPVYQGDIDRILGVLDVRKTLAALRHQTPAHEMLRERIAEPYFVPSGAPVFQQLRYFQENRRKVALIVNEYGEVQGLITPEDIIEELIGEFTTLAPRASRMRASWNSDGECIVAGSMTLRELNRWLELQLPTQGPKTLNGLILEALHEIPEGNVSLQIGGCRMQIMQIDQQVIKTVKLFRPDK